MTWTKPSSEYQVTLTFPVDMNPAKRPSSGAFHFTGFQTLEYINVGQMGTRTLVIMIATDGEDPGPGMALSIDAGVEPNIFETATGYDYPAMPNLPFVPH